MVMQLPDNPHLRFRYQAWWISIIFLFVGAVSAGFGFTKLHADLSFIIEDNPFIANLIYLGFIVSVSERILEVVVKTFRRRTRIAYELEIQNANVLANERQLQHQLQCYRAETGRLTLAIALVIGCTFASLGIFRLFGALSIEGLLVGKFHMILVHAVDVVVTGWVVAGGTEGWSKLVTSLRDVTSMSKDFRSNK